MSGAGRVNGVPTERPPRAPRVITLLALLYAVVAAAASATAVWLVRDDLPAQIAVHWGSDGRPDRFSGLTELLVTNTILALAVPLLLLGVGVGLRVERSMAAVSSGMTTFLGVVLTGSTLVQRGVVEPAEVGVTAMIWGGTAAGLLVGGLVWLIVRRHPDDYAVASGSLIEGAPTLRVSPTTRLAWTGHTRVARWIWLIAGIALVPMLAISAVFASNRAWMDALLMLLLGVALGVVVLASAYSRVTIDAEGLRVTGAGIFRWVRLPLANIQGAVVTTVDPLGDFGGFGRRVAFDGKREGMVTSKGEAILVQRAEERPVVVTIDDAHRAAATLNTLLVREHLSP